MKIAIKPLDARFSRFIRTRDKWTCQRCHKKYTPPTNALHCAHMFSRRHYGVRFDESNACALCYGCHSYIDSHPEEKIEFFKSKLGEELYEYLRMKSKTYCRTKDEMFSADLWLKKEGF